jgi:hypothetical protein
MIPLGFLAHKAMGKVPVRRIRSASGTMVSATMDGYVMGKVYESPMPEHLVVNAQALLIRPISSNHRYAWFVEVRARNGRVCWRQLYDHQAFLTVKHQDMHPTFEEVIEVQPGHTYHVLVGLKTNPNLDKDGAAIGFYQKVN